MNPEQRRLTILINKASSQLQKYEYALSVVPTAELKFRRKIWTLEEKLLNYKAQLNGLPEPKLRTLSEKRQRRFKYSVPNFEYLTLEENKINFSYPHYMTIPEMEKVEFTVGRFVKEAKRRLIKKQKELDEVYYFHERPAIDESSYYVTGYIGKMKVVTLGVERAVKFGFPTRIVINDLIRFAEALKGHHKSAIENRVKTESEKKDFLENEIREMVLTIAKHHGHRMKETPQGLFVYAGDKTLKISRGGFVRLWFSAESFKDFDDYEFWIEKVRSEGKGTPVANHVAYHVSKKERFKGEF